MKKITYESFFAMYNNEIYINDVNSNTNVKKWYCEANLNYLNLNFYKEINTFIDYKDFEVINLAFSKLLTKIWV